MKKCEYCGEIFEEKTARRRFCSSRCKDRAYYDSQRANSKKAIDENPVNKKASKPDNVVIYCMEANKRNLSYGQFVAKLKDEKVRINHYI